METQEPTFKILHITFPNGTTNTVPLNRENKKHYTEYGTWLTKDKREKYKVEERELTLDEAVALGISEAIQIKFPPVKKASQGSNDDVMKMLVAQNAKLMEMLEEKNKQTQKK